MTTETAASPTSIDLDRVRRIADDMKAMEGPLIPILRAIQDDIGYIDDAAIPVVADVLNLSRAEVFGVVSFYHDFRRAPPPRHVVRLCRAEACQSAGGEGLAKHAESLAGEKPSGEVALEDVFCLGLCAVAPAAMVDGRLAGRLDEARITAIFEGFPSKS